MALEPDMAIICACLPVMRPLVTMLLASPFYRSLTSYLTAGASTSRSRSSAKNGKHAASNTIGGSSLAPNSAARRGARDKNNNHHPQGYALSSFDSLECLRDEDVRDGGVWPSQGDNSLGCLTQVSRSQSTGPNDVPQGAISVKTVVDCHETAGGPFTRS